MAILEKPEGLNVGGRLSYHNFTAQSAYDNAHRPDSKLPPRQRPATVQDAKASMSILLNEAGYDIVKEYVLDNVIPWFRQQVDAGDPKVNVTSDDLDKLEQAVKDDNWEKGGGLPFSPLNEKTQELAPASHTSMTLKAYRPGTDFRLEAFVSEEEQLISKPFSKKGVFPIEDTFMELYSGAYVKATVSFWIIEVNGNVYLTANTNGVVFWKDGAAFVGGGSDVEGMIADDDDLFMD